VALLALAGADAFEIIELWFRASEKTIRPGRMR
jgi:hypothetical protein